MENPQNRWEKARNTCLVATLARLGHFPTRETEKEAWFLSPLRSETQASFKISKRLNLWYDFGIGEGGGTIELVCRLQKVNKYEALDLLDGIIEPIRRIKTIRVKVPRPSIKIQRIIKLQHPNLLRYLLQRRIAREMGLKYLREIHYTMYGRNYYSLGLENRMGGWELRDRYRKLSTSPKAIAMIKRDGTNLTLVEGMFDMLSLLKIDPDWLKNSDIMVLNSVAFANRVPLMINSYRNINLALDNDGAGNRATELILKFENRCIDRRQLYSGFKDVNDMLVEMKM